MWNWTVTLLYWLGGCFPDSDVPGMPAGICSDVDSPPGSEGFAGSEDWGYIRPGAGSESPFHDRPVTGSHLFGSSTTWNIQGV